MMTSMMTKRRLKQAAGAALGMAAALTMVLGAPAAARAHEGHDHKVMGTVTAIKDTHLEVKGADGKTVAFILTDQTKVLRGKTPATRADIKPEMRVVVIAAATPKTAQSAEHKNAHGETPMTAKEVRLGAMSGTSGTDAGAARH